MARPETRNHRSLVDDDLIEWLGKFTKEEQVIVWSLMQEADEFADDDLMEAMRRYIRTGSAVGGDRTDMIAKVAMRDDQLKDAAEMRAPAGNPALPKGP